MKIRNLMRAALPAAVVIALMLNSAVASANCSKPNWSKAAQAGGQAPQAQSNGTGPANRNGSIAGLWRTFYSVGGSPLMQSFESWYADGNEFEGANIAPGVFCQGTWEQVSPGTYKLVHVGWNFNLDGSLAGYFVETQLNTLNPDGNSYTGTFAFTNFLMDGSLDNSGNFPNFSGTLTSTRISPN